MFREISFNSRKCCKEKAEALNKKAGTSEELKTAVPNKAARKPGIFSNSDSEGTFQFRKYFSRGDLPVALNFNGAHRSLKWLLDPETIDLKLYLPIFISGLSDNDERFLFIAAEGTRELIDKNSAKIKSIIPHLVMPLKRVLDSSDKETVIRGVKVMQTMLQNDPHCATELISYARNLLAPLNKFIRKNEKLGDLIEYSQQKRINLADLIVETLNVLETYGGPHAFVNIKYMIPTYEPYVQKR